jgi:pimeloyl-ACP methyl ester carboxylesterase/DNA-binding CsgD family transcriptional regulator
MDGAGVEYATTADGLRIAYSVSGDGPPLLLVEGLLANLAGVSAYGRDFGPFNRFYERLQDGHRLIRFDKRGHGFSDRGQGDSTLDSIVRDLTAVADAATGGPVDLCGVSLGGQAAIRYAATAPHKVRRLVLIGSIGEFNERERATSSALAEMYRANWGIATKAMADLLGLKTPADQRRVADAQRRVAERDAIVGELLASQGGTLDEAKRLPHRTLIIHSRDDRAMPFRHGRDLASAIEHSRLIPIAGDHNFYGSEVVPSAILEFLAGDTPAEAPAHVADAQGHRLGRTEHATVPHSSGGSRDEPVDTAAITPRQRDVLERVALGETNQQIAEALEIAQGTVKRHVSDLLHKTGLDNRRQLMRFFDDYESGGRRSVGDG